MPSNYPGAIDSYSTKVNNIDDVDASHVNNLQDAVVAIETELGTNPSGSNATVAARFSSIETQLAGLGSDLTPYRISVTVASNNLTVAIKDKNGNDPSPSSPVKIQIGSDVRTITSALSVTANAGTNWFNAGSSELGNREVDYFVYIGYNSTDGVVIGFSRVPYARLYSHFSATSTVARYCRISNITNASANDSYVVVGRFSATLSPAFAWSVPSFTNNNLVHSPIFETRWLAWQPTYAGSASMTFSSVTTTQAIYKIEGEKIIVSVDVTGTTGGTASYGIRMTAPISANSTKITTAYGPCYIVDGTKPGGFLRYIPSSYDGLEATRLDEASFGLGTGRIVRGTLIYPI
jgi:hypothetical protein